MVKKLRDLILGLAGCQIFGPKNIVVSGITDDSQKVEKGNIFVAIKGLNFDGHDFIPQAIFSGVSVIVGEKDPKNLKTGKLTYIKVKNSREALALLASAWYGYPSKKMKLVGVTGTDGKTTTATLIYSILKMAGKKVGLISTVSAKIGDKEYDTGFHVTNPEPLPLQKFLALMVDKGCEWAVLEVTSHGLDQERVAGMKFEISVLTNITHEHLDYHGTYENYLRVKAKLFSNSKVAILNKEDSSFEQVRRVLTKNVKVISYGLATLKGSLKKVVERRFPEDYNQLNAAGASAVARYLGIEEKDILQSIKAFPGIVGRMEEIKNDLGIRIIIDFAHTPNALESVLSALKAQLPVGKRLICVFGCAGERDKEKRPMMGEISARLADASVFTAEDPRSENVVDIIKQMMKGAKKANGVEIHQIPDRGEAIWFAINKAAKNGDTVVICGKGHERSMAYNGVEYPWSDAEAVALSLAGQVKKITKKIHFMGIGGSGMSGIAILAYKMGYEVSGCDLGKDTAYLSKVKKYIKKVFVGHKKSHLEGIDLLIITPAVLYQNKNHPEFVEGKRRGIVLTWQEFLGKELHKGKKVICIAGTHGKSTTTGMAVKLLEDAGLDPSAVIGAKLNSSGESFRFGKGDYFVTEADEFFDNFLNYHPEIIILNNIEFDHPDYFASEEKVFESFKKFVGNLVGEKILIANADSRGVQRLLNSIDRSGIKIFMYSFKDSKIDFKLKVPGKHNIENALGVALLGRILGIKKEVVRNSLEGYTGIGRRLEFLGEAGGVKVYDDYAHHPTAIAATLDALREVYPNERIWAVVEAHGYQRTFALLDLYKGVFKDANNVVIGPIFKARDTKTFGINERVIAKASNHKNVLSFNDLEKMFDYLKNNLRKEDVVLVMGAGKSYEWSRKILDSLK